MRHPFGPSPLLLRICQRVMRVYSHKFGKDVILSLIVLITHKAVTTCTIKASEAIASQKIL
jgi:hypothetical protein